MRDTIVIGAGLSGLMGALGLAEAGRRPLVLAKGQGATHWTSGTIDIWGSDTSRSLRDQLQQLIAERPDHPYARGGLAAVEAAIERFKALMQTAGYPYVGGLDRNVLLPTALGALRPAALMPATMAAGDIRLGGEILLAGFHELRDFFPPLAADNLNSQAIAARSVYLQLPQTKRKLDFSTRNFAQLFDDPAFRQDIGKQLRQQRGNATRIGLPAVLGLRDPMGVIADLQQLSGAQIFEIPTLPPSVPGMRLYSIFRDAIIKAGGRLQIGADVLRGEGDQQQLKAVYSAAAARDLEERASAFILATGGIAGGGIRTDHTGAVWETALGLPLRAPDGRGSWFASRFLSDTGHPIYHAGIATNEHMRPVNADGQVVYQNVTVAGAALSDCDAVRERCYAGMALATGWRAARLICNVE